MPVLEQRWSSYTRGDSIALVPFRERQTSTHYERRPPSVREQSRPYRFTSRPASEMKRHATFERNLVKPSVQSRRLPLPRRRGLLMDNYRRMDVHLRQPVDVRRNHEDRRPLASYSRRNTHEDSRIFARLNS